MLTSGRPLRRRNTPTSPRMPWRERLDLSWQSKLAKGKTRIYIYIYIHIIYEYIQYIYIYMIYIYMIYIYIWYIYIFDIYIYDIYIYLLYLYIYMINDLYIYMVYDIYIYIWYMIYIYIIIYIYIFTYIYIYIYIYIIISYKKSISVVINWWERISLFFFLTFSASFGGFGPRGIDFVSLRNRRFLCMSNWENCADPSGIFSDGREWAAGLDGMMHEIHWNPRKVRID